MPKQVVATAGLNRLGLSAPKQEILGPPRFLPAVAQGALGIEYRQDRPEMAELLAFLNHADTADQIAAERSFLLRLEGGCQVPIAAHSVLDADGGLTLTGFVADTDGSNPLRLTISGPREEAASLGLALADSILEAGGREILARVYARG